MDWCLYDIGLRHERVVRQTISFQIFEGCLLQILLGPFLNTLSHVDLQLINSMHLFD